ncbi:MAG: CPBP family glutamic-type intramembrane protease [Planctomycetota bacterium]|jgi:hypothetical protein
MRESVERYAEATRASHYTLALVLPFVAIYEVGILALSLSHQSFVPRNGADAIIRNLLFPLRLQNAGALGAFAWSMISVIVLATCWGVWRARERAREREGGLPRPRLEGRYVWWLFGESAAWAVVLLVASLVFFRGVYGGQSVRAATDSFGLRVAAELVFNAGAGVYEELVFRVFLVLVLALFFTKIVHLDRTQGGVAAAVAAALIFSLAHFGSGPGADPWGGARFWPLFFFRAMAGLFFSLIFYFRSFGVAVAAHAFYDNLVTAANAF